MLTSTHMSVGVWRVVEYNPCLNAHIWRVEAVGRDLAIAVGAVVEQQLDHAQVVLACRN